MLRVRPERRPAFATCPGRHGQIHAISTDRTWTPALSYRGLGASGILYPSFQAAYEDHAQLSASDYGHWTITSYTLAGDDHPAIAIPSR